ncbi:NtaA/DmoA family FMN-dependent monooxygenase [Subtercola sp. YIM 133946]|uniref:NtaA/DmoA family FMN-dependent monooxygenase n=1 Tax=Subtercola sp. YIM 133946 TaxID=3118909 RepID=UPI002F921BA6
MTDTSSVHPRAFHLSWFLNYGVDEWNDPWASGGGNLDGSFYVDVARMLERAGFDFVLIEDKVAISETYGGSRDHDLKHALAPKLDPAPLATLIAAGTERLGVVPTLSTSFYPPYLLARLTSTIDHISHGRAGWNIVTSGEDLAARNFGLDALHEHDHRYERAEEYVELAKQLWDSWEPDAIIRDRTTNTYADPSKVHAIDFEGHFHRSRGPLNTARSPQGRPVLCQAGASPRGRAFAARHADVIVAVAVSPEEMREFRDDIRARVAAEGRHPDTCKVLFIVAPIIADTMEEARARQDRLLDNPQFAERVLVMISSISGVDFSQFDLDAPVPDDVRTNGERGSLAQWLRKGAGKTLREHARRGLDDGVELVGTAAHVAARMGEVMEIAGGDGFLITSPVNRLNRRYVIEITEGLVPELQRRGLARTEYSSPLFRDNLLAF